MEVGVVIALLQIKKLKCTEDKQLGKGVSEGNKRVDSNPGWQAY